MSEPAPTPPWSLARFSRQGREADVEIWTAEAVHSQAFHNRSEIDTAIQHFLADGYEPFRVTQDGDYHCIWFKVRLPSISATP
jgi:hypothetical protein